MGIHLLKMYAKIIISCGYELFCDKIEASFLVRSFGCAFFVLWEEKAMNFDLHKFVSEADEKIPETVSDSSGAVLTPGKPQTCEGNGSNDLRQADAAVEQSQICPFMLTGQRSRQQGKRNRVH